MPTPVVPVTHEERERVSRERYEAARALKCDTASQLTEAVALLNSALDARPTFVSALLLRATLLTRCGDVDAALTDLTVAAQLEEGHSVEQRRLAATYATRAALYVRVGKLSAALLDLRRASELEPDNGTWLYELGQVYLRQGNDACAQYYLQAALHDRVAARMSESMRYRALLSLAMCRLHARELTQAAATLDKAARLGDTAALHYLHGLTAYHAGAHRRAVEALRHAAERDQRAVRYRVQLALCAYGVGAYTDALRDLTLALVLQQQQQQQQQHAQQARLLFVRAGVQLPLRLYAQALCDLDAAIALDAQPRFFYAKGLAYMLSATAAAAASSSSSKSGSATTATAAVVADGGDVDDVYAHATVAFAHALRLQPTMHEAHVHLALLAHHAGRLHDALRHVQAAMSLCSAQPQQQQQLQLPSDGHAASLSLSSAATTLSPLVVEEMGLLYSDLGYYSNAVRCLTWCHHYAQQQQQQRQQQEQQRATSLLRVGDSVRSASRSSSSSAAAAAVAMTAEGVTTAATATTTSSPAALCARYALRLATAQLCGGDALAALDTLDAMRTRHTGDRDDTDNKEKENDDDNAPPRDDSVTTPAAAMRRRDGDDADAAEALHMRAMALLQLRRYAAARRCADAAIADAPDNYAYRLGRAALHDAMAQPSDCLDDARSALQLLQLQQQRQQQQQQQQPLTSWCAVPRYMAAVAEAHYLCARAHHERGDVAAALDSLDAAAAAAPALTRNGTYCYARGVLLACAARHVEALQCYDDAIACCRGRRSGDGDGVAVARTHDASTRTHNKADDNDNTTSDEAATTCCAPTVYYHERAKARQLCGDAAGAVADLDVVVSRQPRNVHARLRRALALKQLRRYTAAARDWQCATRHDTTGIVAQLDSEDVFALPYIDLGPPGEEQTSDDDDDDGAVL